MFSLYVSISSSVIYILGNNLLRAAACLPSLATWGGGRFSEVGSDSIDPGVIQLGFRFIRTRDHAFFVLNTYELWLMESQEGDLAADLSRYFNELDEICDNPRPARDLAVAMQADRSVAAYPFEGKSIYLCGYTFGSTVPWPDQAETAPALLIDTARFRIEELAPHGATLDIDVREALARVQARALKPFACVSATWCTPCLEMFESFTDPLMAATLDGIHLLKLDLEAWDREFDDLDLPQFDAIPVFFELSADGVVTGRTIDGNAWEESTPEVLVKVLTPFFQQA